jgi:hypothetical protein
MSKKLVQQARVRTNTTPGSICKIEMESVKFADLWSNYVTGEPYRDPKTGKVPPGYENQCAIRMSATLHKVGVEMKSFTAASVDVKPGKVIGRILLDGKFASTRADELASWLKRLPFCGLPPKPENVTGEEWEKKVRGRTGIVFFGGYWTRDGESQSSASGGHIDLWNGEKMTGFGTGLRARWSIVIPGFWSDLRKAKTILFFQIQ